MIFFKSVIGIWLFFSFLTASFSSLKLFLIAHGCKSAFAKKTNDIAPTRKIAAVIKNTVLHSSCCCFK